MRRHIREAAAKFYDLQPSPFNGRDISLYISLIPTSQSQVLELGCGTRRVLVPLARHCAYIHGVDISERQMWAEMRVDRPCWEQPLGAGRLVSYERIAHVHEGKLICYPMLSYRYYEGDALKEEAVLTIAMRCYYPDEFERLIIAHGFQVLNKWGGYHGEAYGEGPELVIQFTTEEAVPSGRTANHSARRR